ncbi:MAG: dCTP deaminase [Bryobacterales bacterium]|nr:dCTP deaminase [Bryobacterales bacterium]
MILSDAGIKAAIKAGTIEIDPSPIEYSPSAVDLSLGNEFQFWDDERLSVHGVTTIVDLAEQRFPLTAAAYLKDVPRERDGSVVFPPFRVRPFHMLAITRERVHLKIGSKVAARVEGRSSLARLGLMVHITAPTVHAGWNGRITLEMVNLGPFHLKLVPERTRICQLIIERLETDPATDIATTFQGQTRPAGDH